MKDLTQFVAEMFLAFVVVSAVSVAVVWILLMVGAI